MTESRKPVVGVIGAIGAGKSAVAAAFARLGGWLIDADKIGHQVLEETNVKEQLSARWPGVLNDLNRINRKAVAQIVFNDPAEKAFLESVVFPGIRSQCESLITAATANPAVRFVVLDAAVLLEADWESIVDFLIYVDAPTELRQQRVLQRNGWTPEDLAAREASQWPAETKRSKADAVITNDGTLAELNVAVDALITRIIRE